MAGPAEALLSKVGQACCIGVGRQALSLPACRVDQGSIENESYLER